MCEDVTYCHGSPSSWKTCCLRKFALTVMIYLYIFSSSFLNLKAFRLVFGLSLSNKLVNKLVQYLNNTFISLWVTVEDILHTEFKKKIIREGKQNKHPNNIFLQSQRLIHGTVFHPFSCCFNVFVIFVYYTTGLMHMPHTLIASKLWYNLPQTKNLESFP